MGKTAIQLGGLRQPRQIGAARASDSQGAGHRGNTPMMPLISVDLPAPFGPTTAVMPPAAKLPETERSTGCPCQPKEIWSSSMAAPAARNPRRTRAAARRSCAPNPAPSWSAPTGRQRPTPRGHAAPCGSQDSGADKTPRGRGARPRRQKREVGHTAKTGKGGGRRSREAEFRPISIMLYHNQSTWIFPDPPASGGFLLPSSHRARARASPDRYRPPCPLRPALPQ